MSSPKPNARLTSALIRRRCSLSSPTSCGCTSTPWSPGSRSTADQRLPVAPLAGSPGEDDARALRRGDSRAMDSRDALTGDERAELVRLRAEVAALRVQVRQPEAT